MDKKNKDLIPPYPATTLHTTLLPYPATGLPYPPASYVAGIFRVFMSVYGACVSICL